jgi:hypothetical protein
MRAGRTVCSMAAKSVHPMAVTTAEKAENSVATRDNSKVAHLVEYWAAW